MEKISALIDKLQELKNSDAGLQAISYYTQLLQAEILHQRNLQKQQELKGHGHVAVILPPHTPAPAMEKIASPPPQEKQEKVMQNGYAQDRVPMKSRPQEQAATLFDTPPPKQQPEPDPPAPWQQPVQQPEEAASKVQQPAVEEPVNKGNHLHTNPANTPSHKSPEPSNGIRKELNELISRSTPSLNDTLRSNGKVELGERLGGMGVKDLKDAIGINDKFQFIQELFRSDRTMYDRSIKTINESTSLQEAENWIERELKIKLGWNENDQAVKQFYSLVRKRFS